MYLDDKIKEINEYKKKFDNKKKLIKWLKTRLLSTKNAYNKYRSLTFVDIHNFLLSENNNEYDYDKIKTYVYNKLVEKEKEKEILQNRYNLNKSIELIEELKNVGAERCTYNEVYAYLLAHKPVL